MDIVSGCYMSDGFRAGLFQVLLGKDDGTFLKPQPILGDDENELVIRRKSDEQSSGDGVNEAKQIGLRSLTRPTVVDLNNDGFLDLVSGNAIGTFHFFTGKGDGKFESSCQILKDGAEPIRVPGGSSDPVLVDWDRDGDLDIISGSQMGGVYLATNVGSKSSPSFETFRCLVSKEVPESHSSTTGYKHFPGPQFKTRVCVEDLNQDGLLDLIVGDHVNFQELNQASGTTRVAQLKKNQAESVDSIREKMANIESQMQALKDSNDKEKVAKETKRLMNLQLDLHDEFYAKNERVEDQVRQVSAGFVWVYYQKPNKRKSSKPTL